MKCHLFISSIILSGLLLILAGCTHTSRTPLETALREAGDNRAELEKVLDTYARHPQDSLKYRAACFLIEHMPGLSYYEGEQLDHYLTYYKALHQCPNRTPQQLVDSIVRLHGTPSPGDWQRKTDIQTIDSAFLYNNIEYAFRAWQEFPWCRHLSFGEFCEQLLPYRVQNERLERWRPVLYERYLPIARQLQAEGCTDPVQAARVLTDHLRQQGVRFTMIAPPAMTAIPPSYGQYLCGSCDNVTAYVVCAARAIGIPCAMDFTPLRGNANSGHLWTAYHDRQGRLFLQDFLGEIVPAEASKLQEAVRPMKMYRHTYAIDRPTCESLQALDEQPYPLFAEPRFVDVTDEYRNHHIDSLVVPTHLLYGRKARSKVAYLAHLRRQEWEPVAWTPVGTTGRICFHHLNTGNLTRLVAWSDGEVVPLTDPFLIDDAGGLTVYAPSDTLQPVTLFAKTNLEEEIRFFTRMVDGVFEGSDTPDFRQRDTLHRITQAPHRLYTQVDLTPAKAYRYVRYYGPDSTACNVAEVSFYEQGKPLPTPPGSLIGTPGCWQGDGSHEYTNAFDGLTTTSFDYKAPCGGWAGVDFGTPRHIDRIVYTPRNRDNFIRPGDEYELFFLDKIWVSLGRTVATADSLHYPAVPKHTLLYLKNHSRGYDERIFLYKDGKQEWR